MKSLKALVPWVFFGLLLGGIVYFSLMNQPRNVDPESIDWGEEPQSESEALQKVEEYLAYLESDEVKEESIAEIHEFVRDTRSAIWASRYTSRELQEKLQILESAHAIKGAEKTLARSVEVEQEGRQALAAGQIEVALPLLRQAAELQQEVNETYSTSPPRNHVRYTRLNSEIRNLQAKPMEQESKLLEQQAIEAEAAGEWSKAAELYLEAYNLQMTINQQFQGTPSSDYRRSRTLSEKQKLASAGILFEGVEEKIRQAEAAVAEGQREQASTFYNEAEKEMIDLIERYPANPFASRTRLNDLLVRRENTLAAPMGEEVVKEFERIQQKLRAGENEGLEQSLIALQQRSEQLFKDYPNNTLVSEETRFLILYLVTVRRHIPTIREQALQMLSEERDGNGNQWATTEVPQNLYQEVMRNNPSARKAPELPVTRITLEEAREFCRRLSVILGQTVRLPRVEEYRSVFFDANVKSNWGGWHSGNSAEVVQPVGTSNPGLFGIHDLVGNVGEWAEGDAEASRQGMVAGGSIESDEAEFRSLPVKSLSTRERSPVIGFRFLLETENF